MGSALTQKLLKNNIEVVHLTREKNSKNDVKNYLWDWTKSEFDENSLRGVTHIIHLAGAGIADKAWTNSRKNTIVKSRVLTARLLLSKIKSLNINITTFISASAVGGGRCGALVVDMMDMRLRVLSGYCAATIWAIMPPIEAPMICASS